MRFAGSTSLALCMQTTLVFTCFISARNAWIYGFELGLAVFSSRELSAAGWSVVGQFPLSDCDLSHMATA